MIIYLLFAAAVMYCAWLVAGDEQRRRPAAPPSRSAPNPRRTEPRKATATDDAVLQWTALDDHQLTRLLQQAASSSDGTHPEIEP